MSLIDIIFGTVPNSLIFFIFVFALNIICVFLYKKLAFRFGILAYPNFRTLHELSIPRGGGIVFSFSFIVGVFVLWYLNLLSEKLFFILGLGGTIAVLFGFIDDIYNIRAIRKLLIQICLSAWILFWLEDEIFLNELGLLEFIMLPTLMFFIVWIINAYNFMDGIDGMAATGAFYFSGALTLIMIMTNNFSELTFLFFLLMASVGAFILFNWPPANIFMGDAGSIFLGYVFGAFIIITVFRGELSIWTWLVMFGYFFADTTVTQITRIILVKQYYKAHRSHAYQNLARITGSHFKITFCVTVFHVLWLLPLTLWTVKQPEMEILAVFLAITPGLIVAYKYGPILSSS